MPPSTVTSAGEPSPPDDMRMPVSIMNHMVTAQCPVTIVLLPVS